MRTDNTTAATSSTAASAVWRRLRRDGAVRRCAPDRPRVHSTEPGVIDSTDQRLAYDDIVSRRRWQRAIGHHVASLFATVLLAVVALGVLGVHALSTPGEGHHPSALPMRAAVMAPDSDARPTTAHDGRTSTHGGDRQSHDNDVFMLCGVMLVAVGAIGLMTWLLHGAVRKWRLVKDGTPAVGRTASAPRPPFRGHSPPRSLACSVIRC